MSNEDTYYKNIEDSFTEQELQQISQIKRFFEYYKGDAEFRAAVNADRILPAQLRRIQQIGIHFQPEEIALLWKQPEILDKYLYETDATTPSEIPAEHAESLKAYPLLELWFRFQRHQKELNKKSSAERNPFSRNARYESWRKRRIAAAESELGAYNHHIDHPLFSLELSYGCSVQCWFCAFNAEKLQNVLDYNENRTFFRNVVQTFVDIFGKKAAGCALLYYATEPYDNPHYVDYMRDFEDVTGSAVCTSTAVCTKKQWIDSLQAFYKPRNLPWPRLSVLSTKMLHKIHDQHSPEELRDVSMLMQMKDCQQEKVSGGRIFNENNDMRKRDNTNYMQDIIPQGSIACVTGFYVNLLQKTIKLISPCYTSSQWPKGYRIYDEAQFESAADFQDVLQDMMERNMPLEPPADMPFQLRDDLVFEPLDNGFDLISPNQIHHFQGKRVFQALRDLLASSTVSFQEANDLLVNTYGQSLFEVHAALRHMFDAGFLDEMSLSALCHQEACA